MCSLLSLAAALDAHAAEAAAAAERTASFTIRADWFDRGNVRVSPRGQEYADAFPCIWNGGQAPNESEYAIDFPMSAEYTLSALYAAADSRPVDILLDGRQLHRGFTGVTGSWQTSSAAWETQCVARITGGSHVLTLRCPGPCMPHICALRFEAPGAFPPGWRLARGATRARRPAIEPLVPRAHRLPAMDLAGGDARLTIEVLRTGADAAAGPAAHDELLQEEPEAATPWIARLSLAAPAGADTEILPLAPERLRRMLAHAAELIADYRTMERVPRDFLQAELDEAARIEADTDRACAEPDGAPAWERFCRAYIAACRLEARVARANPLLDFDSLLVVRRGAASPALGLPQNWQSNCALPAAGFDDEIDLLPLAPGGRLARLYRPARPSFVGDVDLHFDAGRLLFSSIGDNGRWQVFEIGIDGTGLRQVTPGDEPDVDSYDACYLPGGGIIFSSTASFAAVPCVNGSTAVANLYRMDAGGTNIRQLCFDQEHNWCPTVMENGRVLYLRWQYTDTPHAHDRLLFHMNPDGTEQMEFYHSNSYWPNAMFYARPIPGQPAKFVCIAGGHHGVPRMGELVVFDAARGRREAEGAVQRIPGRGAKVAPIIADNLVDGSWPKFLHPFPLSDKYFLVAARQTPDSLWGIYLADVFDGMLLLKEEPGCALLEPLPLRRMRTPPVVPDKIDLRRKDAIVYLFDVYFGGGLEGVPRGTVKKLRIISYHYLYPGMGGPQGVVGMEGPWDIKRILGTVPVEDDGSAAFRVPANTPISVQPLDAEGKALQLMRSWFTGMPGEVVACAGCHEGQNSGPPNRATLAARKSPAEIVPWYGPTRGFNFVREVQPVLDRFCTGCHDGRTIEGRTVVDLRGRESIDDYTSRYHHGGVDAGRFTTSYAALHRWVRRPGLESDARMLAPMEFHADTTQLVQMLRRGHHGVALDAEAWDRLITWIDLNCPFHGTWTEIAGEARVAPVAKRRRELLARYGGVLSDPEEIFTPPPRPIEPVMPPPESRLEREPPPCAGRPFDAAEAARRQAALGTVRQTIDLGGATMELVLVPPGEFVMGDGAGFPDERPPSVTPIAKPFWVGRCEVTNAQYACFDPTHDSRVESKNAMQFGVRGFYVNGPRQPVVRVSWREAMAFCEWLSGATGRRFTLPTEAQWEYACRTGTDTPFSHGGLDTDFSVHANLADRTLREYVCDPYSKARAPFADPGKYDDWLPKDERFDDGGFVSEDVGRWRPNAWGLCDMHGNAAEWTLSAYRPYPYRDDGRNDPRAEEPRVVRGGSWRDLPRDCRSASRLPYRPYQKVYNVGFRVVSEAHDPSAAAGKDTPD